MALFFALTIFAVVAWIIMSLYFVVTAESPLSKRLRTLVPQAGSGKRRTTDGGAMGGLLRTVGGYAIGQGSESLPHLLSSAGFRGPNAVATFLGARTLISFGPALIVALPRLSRGEPLVSTLWIAFIIWGVGHMLANIWLRRRRQRRWQLIIEGLPDALDLMVVCLESGLGLNATIARVGEERSNVDDPLGDEFAQVSFELGSGRSREDAMRSLSDRNGIEDLKSLTGLIIQSDRLGASMSKTLRAHADMLRIKRRQRAEETARKLPIKILFPLATMLLPALFIMVLGPAYLQFGALVRTITGGH